MKRRFRSLSLILTLVLFMGVIAAACSSSETTDNEADSSNSSNSPASDLEPVELQFYMVGDAPKDLEMVAEKINALAKKDLNTTIKFNFTTWTDFTTKYNLLLSTGQPIDLIYTASWLDYQKLARKGAFKPLDDLLPKYAPELQKFVPEELWNQVKVAGKIYTIPATWKEYSNGLLMYRKDLQKKYNLPEPNTLENFEAYMDGIKKNMPGQVLTEQTVKPGPVGSSFSTFPFLTAYKYKWVGVDSPYGLVADYDNPSEIRPYWGTPEFIEDMKLMKKWADKGYWSRSSLSSKEDATAFENGKVVAVMSGQNAPKYGANVTKAQTAHPDWEIGAVTFPSVNGVSYVAHASQNGFAVANSSQNPERALMFYQKLVLDKTYNQLSQYGIEGTHYKVEDGKYVPIGDQTKSGFTREGMNGWAWRNEQFMLYPESFDLVKSMFDDMEKIAQKQPKFKGINIYDGFGEDFSSYQSERAALGTVLTQYLAPLEAGLVPDVEAAVKTFMEKAKEAGLEKIQAEYIKQWKEYCETYNYK